MAYKAEVIADSTGTWCGNSLRFATHPEAEAYVSDLYSRWTAVRQTRVVECNDEVNYKWEGGRAFPIITGAPAPASSATGDAA